MSLFGSKPVKSTRLKSEANPQGLFVKPPRASAGRWTVDMLKRAASATGRKLVVDPVSGKIQNMRAVRAVQAYKANMAANGQACPQCGKASRKGYFCRGCALGVAAQLGSFGDSPENSLHDLKGQNKNGIRYRADGSRIFPHDADWHTG